MAYNFSAFKAKATETVDWLKKELLTIQTGRATAAMLDGILVNSYGAKVSLQQVASVTTEDARSLRLVPYNSDDIMAIEQAITDADLGISVSSDDKGVRVHFPELTTETRQKYVKLVGKKHEEAKISLRQERDEIWNDIQKKEKDGEISKDERFRLKEEMEEINKKAAGQLEELATRKEQEVQG